MEKYAEIESFGELSINTSENIKFDCKLKRFNSNNDHVLQKKNYLYLNKIMIIKEKRVNQKILDHLQPIINPIRKGK